jgi:arylsulfatase A-like enzyme
VSYHCGTSRPGSTPRHAHEREDGILGIDRLNRKRFAIRYWLAVLMLLLAGVAASVFVVPSLIVAAYEGRSIGLLNRLIGGQDQNPADAYLDLWSRLWPRAALAFVVLAAALFLLIHFRQRIRATVADIAASIPRTAPSQVPLLGLSLGLAVGALEGFLVDGFRLFGHDARGDVSRHVIWMAPVASGLLFGAIGVALWPLARRWPRLVSVPVLLVVLGTPAIFGLTRSLGQGIMTWAAWVLSLGIAVFLARAAARRAERAHRLMGRATRGLALWTVATACIVFALDPLRTAIGLARLPEAHAGPNIILLILDTVRASSLSLHGYDRPTSPVLERLAQQSVVFDGAIATSSWTLPSHASMFTGRFNRDLQTTWHEPLDGTHPTLAEVLRDNGYETAAFVGNLVYTSRETGLLRGFLRRHDQPVTAAAAAKNSWLVRRLVEKAMKSSGNERSLLRKRAGVVTRAFLAWLDARDDARPFFVFLNYFDAHDPYTLPAGASARFAPDGARYWLGSDGTIYSPGELANLRDTYDDAILSLDAHLGTLFDELERRGTLENTILVIASDHGEQFGERAPHLVMHGNTLSLPSVHVPLLMHHPGTVPAGLRVPGWVSLADLPATLLDLAGLPARLPGTSLAAHWRTPDAVTRPPISELDPNWHSVRTGQVRSVLSGSLHYLSNENGTEELYDVITDPWERKDLSTQEGWRALPLRATLESVLGARQPDQ